ncbi:adenosylcobinamide-GDP ribazoletransferase [Sphingobium sp.]|uniref:adenosylcobinamide-GDP ribazoletransferase n=1 Tax=Sphingobium sp. TaxID=1912891 RepID=UPI003BB53688
MKGLIIALQFLTRLPMPRVQLEGDDFARSMRWFPAAGLVIGALVAGAAMLGLRIDSWTAALCALLVWVGVTGGLHLDGLSDLADARGAGHKDKARFLAVMADPHVGSFGVVAIVLQLIAKLVLLHGLAETGHLLGLILIPFAARIGPLLWTLWLPPLHAGLGAQFRQGVAPRHVIIWGLLLTASALFYPAMMAAPLLILLWVLWLKRHVGGISGDCHGAGIELIETGLLAALLI